MEIIDKETNKKQTKKLTEEEIEEKIIRVTMERTGMTYEQVKDQADSFNF